MRSWHISFIRYLSFSTILLLFLLSSCEYTPGDVFINPTTAGNGEPDVQVMSLDLDLDTIFLYVDKRVSFRFSCANQEILTIQYLVNDSVYGTVDSEAGEFVIEMNAFIEGTYDLALRVVTGSGTGSIAEQLGAEGYFVEHHWVLQVVRNWNEGTRFSSENGYLRLDWTAYKGGDFKEYRIYRIDGNNQAQFIGKSYNTHFLDTCYVGEGGEYSIHALLASGQDILWGSLQINRELPRLFFSSTNNNQYFIYWIKNRFYNGVAAVKVYLEGNSGNYNLVHTSISYQDSIYYTDNHLFGDQFRIRIELIPKRYTFTYIPAYNEYYAVEKEVMAGFRFASNIFPSDPVKLAENNEIIFDDGDLGLARFSLTTLQRIQVYNYSGQGCFISGFNRLEVSPLGKYFSAYGCDWDIVLTAPSSNPGNSSMKSMSYLMGQYVPAVPLSDTRIGLVNSLLGGIYLFNFNTGSVVAEYTENPSTSTGMCISSNANYMIFYVGGDFKLFHYANHQFTEVHSFPYASSSLFEFSHADPDQFAWWDGEKLEILRCSDMGTVSSIVVPDETLLSVDYHNHQALFSSGLHLLVRSTNDGSLLHDVPVNNINLFDYYHCILADHKIISNLGLLYFL